MGFIKPKPKFLLKIYEANMEEARLVSAEEITELIEHDITKI
jgi:hypothetical protein